ncbi:stage III sporulation protein AG [Paenibacillus baekrokdamisoli]|uniref:Stage III sporulation protein AG n=1 Tax=Paenibacillus baekrokdamisoli TaxID=1712516 RepID=A0A3G9IY96_9BACL|nr:stage III sporulation protein AG [Paenibacillus baekrokdamisoli]MBB3070103.1 stage III sporulation protein AG [Paenibacillus baekrokdamisoli]BBH21115.1 stage III sporulation protein AG [Paenibacillus baekrokdamisoli]
MAKWLEGLESVVGGGPGGPKRVRTLRWLLVIGGIGAMLMLMNSFLSFKNVDPSPQQPEASAVSADQSALGRNSDGDSFESIEQPLEIRLKEILEKIVGVGSVDVLLTIDSTEEVVVERNDKESQQVTNETDKSGGKRNMTSITKDGQVVLYQTSNSQSPIIQKRIKPKIRGVLIVAKGAENMTVRHLIMDAVEKGINVPVNRISVVPKKHQ